MENLQSRVGRKDRSADRATAPKMPHPPTSLRIFISNNLATLHHELHALERGHIFQRIPVNRDDVSPRAGLEAAHFPGPSQQIGGIHRRGFYWLWGGGGQCRH